MSAKMDSSNTKCDCPEKKKNHSILYALLSSGTTASTTTTSTSTTTTETEEQQQQQQQQQTANNQVAIFPWDCTLRSPHNTHFVPSIVKLKYPEEVCQYAAQLLLKTVDFIKNLPSILCLSWNDRTALLQHCWSELLILTMAQYQFFIEVEKVSLSTESDVNNTTSSSSSSSLPSSVNVSKSAMTSLEKSCPENDCREGALLKYIIAMQGIPTASDIDTLNAFFHKCQTLQLDDKEFAYLKSTIFFNPDVTGLSSSGLVETLQSHAQLQLSEYVTALHPHDPLRFAHLLLSLPPLRNVRARVITHLFFRELIGDVEMEEILRQMLMHAQ